MLSLSSARQSEVKAWEEEITACEHTLCLEQLQSGAIPQEGNDEFLVYHNLIFISISRFSTLRLLRAYLKSLALSHLWCSGVRQSPIWWHWWQWPCTCTFQCYPAPGMCKTWNYYTRGWSRLVRIHSTIYYMCLTRSKMYTATHATMPVSIQSLQHTSTPLVSTSRHRRKLRRA